MSTTTTVATPITVEQARALAAQHGQDRLIVIGWSREGQLNVVHVGSTPEDSKAASFLAEFLLKTMGYDTNDTQTQSAYDPNAIQSAQP